MTPRPILMPGGWPRTKCDRDACSRVLLACGGDLNRVFDEPLYDMAAYVRQMARVPCYKFVGVQPLFFVAGRIVQPETLIDLMQRIFEATDVLNHASWITYQPAARLPAFLDSAARCADIDEAYTNIFYWYTEPRPTLVTTRGSNAPLVQRALTLLEATPDATLVVPGATSTIPPPTHERPQFECPGVVVGLESLAQLRAVTEPTSESKTDRLGLGQFTPVRPNPRIRRNAS